MSGTLGTLSDRQRDRVLAVAAAVFAAILLTGARAIEDSLLSDAVGAGGVPQGVALMMGAAALALFCKSFLGAPTAATTAGSATDNTPAGGAALSWQAAFSRTAGLVAILLGYGLLLPTLGYTLTVCLLVGASGWLAGAPLKAPLLLCAVIAGPLLWAMFDWALKVRMPVGSLWGG